MADPTTDQQRLSAIQKPVHNADKYRKQAREDLCGGHFSDEQVAFKAAMLMRSDLDHEAVVTMAKDRIRWLSTQLSVALAQLSTPKPEATHFAESAKCLSREGGEFDEAAERVKFEASCPERQPHWWNRQRGRYVAWIEREWQSWLARARIVHTEEAALRNITAEAEELIAQHWDSLTEARKRIAELEAALWPFAIMVGGYSKTAPDNEQPEWDDTVILDKDARFTIGHLRRAAALNPARPTAEEMADV